jgi:hypothetical protein
MLLSGQGQLLEMVLTLDAASGLACGLHGGQEHGHEAADHRQNH